MKTIVKQLAAGTFIAFSLLVGNVKAEATETTASNCENIETTLQLEKWMTDETIWNTNSGNIAEFNRETELELEGWMISAELWDTNYGFNQEAEPGLELEGWMINEITWNTNNTEQEPVLTVEAWMLAKNVWK